MVKSQNKTALIFVSWLLATICMGVIFWLSSRPATVSSSQSSGMIQWINDTFGIKLSSFFVRKTAHFLEFAGLSLLINNAVYQSCGRKKIILSVFLTSLYALSDEIHQIFVVGRACQFRDWVIDTGGAVFGILIFLFLFWLIVALKGGKNENALSRS